MIDIKYKGNFEVSDIDGESIAGARNHFQKSFNIPDKAAALLNGKPVTRADEALITLKDKDTLVFKSAGSHRMAYLVGALLLAMAITGGVFAYGFTNATVSIGASTVSYNFADVTANTSSVPSWSTRGMEKGVTGSGTLFDINTTNSGYPGDLSVTVMMTNADELVSVYRNLNLTLEVRDTADNLVDINGDGVSDSSDFTMLSLNNGTVTFTIEQTAAKNYTILLRNGSYIANVAVPAWSSAAAPQLFCELAQQ